MDLLGDLGATDQLTSARCENAALTTKVRELSSRNKILELENASLLAEVEIYRKEAALPSFSNLALGKKTECDMDVDAIASDAFVTSGNGIYASKAEVTLPKIHGMSNPTCCALRPEDDSLLATGGADCYLSLVRWGAAMAPTPNAAEETVRKAVRVRLDAPVINAVFAPRSSQAGDIVAAGCMDGSVRLASYETGPTGNLELRTLTLSQEIRHGKYIKAMSWSTNAPVLASASADGSVLLSKISLAGGVNDGSQRTIEILKKFHFENAVEALCFLDGGNTLCCYERNTPYLSYFNLLDGFKRVKHSLNGEITGGFDTHTSFCVMQMVPSPNDGGKFLALATDSSRNIIIESGTPKIIRNLYGHKNDGFAQPRIAWSQNGQYLFGNTQEDNSICVWDISTSSIVKRLEGHDGQVRDMCSTPCSDTLVTVSYDKSAKLWLREF